ncbi:non-ribosomal peptide synthetase [Micromonospora sp. WMMD961]|uniref:non-ribosomal peptide synthetase n=1 Tax=Micromonospora sp. WMMD961 TaxID=3016100 RepID=UPI00241724CA|nr:non-ribosomal peptide synthetase [Micromonospora sp. WMMD961]MDG4780085.1 non-ribosomal peptide synthetase [Micromonospora sp. WMMD961]
MARVRLDESIISRSAHELVGAWLRRSPDATAVREAVTGRELTYRELWQESTRLATELTRHGARRGDTVALALGRSAELIVAILAVARCGAAYLPLDAGNPADRTAAIITEAEARLVVTATHGEPTGWTLTADLTRVPAGGAGATPTTSGEPTFDEGAHGDEALYVAYTSGSTGRPKGVVVPHRAVVGLVDGAEYCPVAPGDRVVNLSNPAFDATTFEVWSTLTAGGTLVVLPAVTEVTLDEWVELLRAERITTMFLTTSLFHMVARERPAAFGTVRNLLVGGEQMQLAAARAVLAATPPRRLVNAYGPTETTTFAAYHEVTAANLADVDRVPIGRALQHTTLHLLDDQQRPVAAGATGELCIGGPKVALGYLGQPELTAQRFVRLPDGEVVYRSGDLARRTADGDVELLGRRDRQVKLRGFRIELEEIERAAMATGLADVAIVEKVGEGPQALLVGFVLPAPGTAPTASQLSAALLARVPRYMVPARWIVLDALPVGQTGKADRDALLALVNDDGFGGDDSGDPVLAGVTETWRDVLSLGSVSRTDTFLDLGGNSILAIQAASRLSERLGVEVEPHDVLLATSAADLGDRLRDRQPVAI